MINLISAICKTSYGLVGRQLVQELDCALFPVHDRRFIECEEWEKHKILESLHKAEFFDQNAPCLRIWHQHDMAQFVGRGPRIGMPIFELNKFKPVEKHHLSTLDHIIVNSSWAKQIIEDNKIDISTSVIPLGVNTNIFFPSPKPSGKTIFLNISKWEVRKGHLILPQIFSSAFSSNDNVELWMVPYNPFLSAENVKKMLRPYEESPLRNKIRILNPLQNSADIAKLINMSDCGIYPSLAEGFLLGGLETLACGKHLIITNYSGQLSYANSENSMLIDIDELEPAVDENWPQFNGFGEWAKFGQSQFDQCVEYMRKVHKLKQTNNLEQNIAGINTAQKMTWKDMANAINKLCSGESKILC